MTATRTRQAPALPGAALSMFDPVFAGLDETGQPVYLDFADHMGIVLAGEPGAGKSVALANIVAHGALSFSDCRLVLIDGALVELGAWRSCADTFVGPDINQAIAVLEDQQQVINDRCEELLDTGRRKIVKGDGVPMTLTAVDELAYYSATVGTSVQQKAYNAANRDVVARGRAPGIIAVEATQRPSADIVPTSLRDLFGYRWAFRCSTEASSDTILGHGWASKGYTAEDIDPQARPTHRAPGHASQPPLQADDTVVPLHRDGNAA